MATTIDIEQEKEKKELITLLQKAIQSCNLNFLIGAGCSCPLIPASGPIEKEIDELYCRDKKMRLRRNCMTS